VLVSDTALSVLLTATTALAATEDRADKEGKTKIANGVGFKVYKNSLEDAVKAEALKQIGRIRSREYEWDIALENYETSLEILNRFGNLCEIGNIYNATGFNESVINQRPNFWHTELRSRDTESVGAKSHTRKMSGLWFEMLSLLWLLYVDLRKLRRWRVYESRQPDFDPSLSSFSLIRSLFPYFQSAFK